LVVAAIWTYIRNEEGPPVLQLALTLQWVEVSIGLFYVVWTGRPLEATLNSDYRPMVAIGLGCVVALTVGVWGGQYLIARMKPVTGWRPDHALTFKTLVLSYAVGVAGVGAVNQFAWEYPSITQAVNAVSYGPLGLLFLVFPRLVASAQRLSLAGLLLFRGVLRL